ncbi:MAG: hypothetical protein WC560_03125 [Syntrophales bacterium]
MKETTANDKSNDLYFGGHLVAFIHILGRSRHLTKLQEKRQWECRELTIAAFRETYGKIIKFRRFFSDFLSEFTKPSPLDDALRHVLGGEELKVCEHIGSNRTLNRSLSDSLILTFPLIGSNGLFPLNSIYGVLAACAASILMAFNYGFAVRGAIEIGPCLFDITTNEVYGTALSGAVRSEKEADWPRILVGPELVVYLRECLELPQGSTINQLNSSSAALCLKVVSRVDDGLYFLDYLSPEFTDLWPLPNIDMAVQGAVKFIKSQISENDSTKVKNKYEMLKAYFVSRGIAAF